MKWIAHFAVDILLLHHYKSNLAHLSYFDSLAIGIKNEGLLVIEYRIVMKNKSSE